MKPMFIATYPAVDEDTKRRFMEAMAQLGDNPIRIPHVAAVEFVNARPLSKYWQRRFAFLRRRGKAQRWKVDLQIAGAVSEVTVTVST